jgi:hypothetical protein
MRIPRKSLNLIVIFFALAACGKAQMTCTNSFPSSFDMRAEGAMEQAGDLVVVCSGGTPTPAGIAVPQVNITVTANANITSRLLNGSTSVTEALLLVDDPTPVAQAYCNSQTTGCPMLGTGHGGGTGLGGPTTGNTGSPVSASVNATNPYSPLAAPIGTGRFNAYGGVLVAANTITFFGVPIDPPGPLGGQMTLRITNICMNASSLASVNAVEATETISNSAGFVINNALQTSGVVREAFGPRTVTSGTSSTSGSPGTISQCVSTPASSFPIVETVNFSEGIATATRLRLPVDRTALSVAGNRLDTESQFVLSGTPPSPNFGQADSGTRIKIRFGGLPQGLQIFVPTTVSSAPNGTVTETLSLTAAETGPFSAVAASTAAGLPTGYAQLTIGSGEAVAIYEVTSETVTSRLSIDAFSVPVAVSYIAPNANYTGNFGVTGVSVDLAPDTNSSLTASGTGAFPRFVPTSSVLPGFTVSACTTPSGGPTVVIEQTAAANGTVTLSGWALDNSASGTAIHSAGIVIDGVSVGNATYGASRPDICGLFPGRPGCPNVGFTYSGPLGAGTHTISVVATNSSIPAVAGSASVTVSVAAVPTAVSVTPSAGSGSSQIFTAVYSDTAGASFLSRASFLVNSSVDGAGACFVKVDTTGIYLINDANSGLSGPLSVGGALSNSQCTLNGTGSGTVNAGNNSTVTLSITFKAAFAGAKNIYMVAEDNNGNSTGFQMRGTFTVAAPPGLYFVPITPCRVLDTRKSTGPFGGPSIAGQTSRSFVIPDGACGIPSNAQAYSMNVAVVPQGGLGFLTVWPTGESQPRVATLNSDGRVKSNAAIIPAGTGGAVSVFATNTTDVIFDINGYFLPAGGTGLQFYPVTPCRLVDTRHANAPLGGPFIPGLNTRTFPLTSGSCGIPSGVQAYSLNLAAVPRNGTLSFLTAWAAGQAQPLAATLNAPTGTVVSNAAIVPAGTGGSISVFATQDTDLVIDVNGYFAAPGSAGALSFYAATPCRVLDSRQPAGSQPFVGTIDVNVAASGCGAPVTAQAFVFNATVVPPAGLGFLTLWPLAAAQPTVATLNASDAAVTGNMAIVPGASGSISAFATNPTHLVLDLFGYFAP